MATKRDVLGDVRSNHGTPVAAIIAARRDGVGTQGFAPDAKIAVLRIDDWDEDTSTESLRHGITAIDYAASVGIKVVNASVTSGGLMPYGNAVARLGATGGLLVASAGNVGGANPADANAVTDANRDAFLFVVAIGGYLDGYDKAPYSNSAGTMRARTVAAVGSNITTLVDGSVGNFNGTSSAAPVVSALAATILSKWPQLTGKQAGEVILNTAKDIGAPGVGEVFGRGLVDFKAALSPVSPTLSNGAQVTSLQASVMAVPGPVGLTQLQAALSDVTVLDTYGRDFRGSLSGLVVAAERPDDRWLRRRIAGMGQAGGGVIAAGPVSGSLGFSTYRYGPGAADVATVATGGEVALQTGRTGVRAGINAREALQRDAMGLAPSSDGVLAYASVVNGSLGVDRFVGGSGGRVGLTLSAGRVGSVSATAATLGWTTPDAAVRVSWVEEDGAVLGAPSYGALALGRGTSMALVSAAASSSIKQGDRYMGTSRIMVAIATVAIATSGADAQSGLLGRIIERIGAGRQSAGQAPARSAQPAAMVPPTPEQATTTKAVVTKARGEPRTTADVMEAADLIERLATTGACASNGTAWNRFNREAVTPKTWSLYGDTHYTARFMDEYHDARSCYDVIRIASVAKPAANALEFTAFYVSPSSQAARRQHFVLVRMDGAWMVKQIDAVERN